MAEKPTISVIEPLKTDLAEAEPARREEFFLDAIAGGTNGEALEPMDRPEEFLRRIAERETYQEGEINRVYDQIPVVPEAGDVGKVLTVAAGGEGEAPKWEAKEVTLPERESFLHRAFTTEDIKTGNYEYRYNKPAFAQFLRDNFSGSASGADRINIANSKLYISIFGLRLLCDNASTAGTLVFRTYMPFPISYNGEVITCLICLCLYLLWDATNYIRVRVNQTYQGATFLLPDGSYVADNNDVTIMPLSDYITIIKEA